jgi:hypothetical protein
MAEQVFLGVPDVKIGEDDDNMCSWSTNKLGGRPVCIYISIEFQQFVYWQQKLKIIWTIIQHRLQILFVFRRTGCLVSLRTTHHVTYVEESYFLFPKSIALWLSLNTIGHFIYLAVLIIHHAGTNQRGKLKQLELHNQASQVYLW